MCQMVAINVRLRNPQLFHLKRKQRLTAADLQIFDGSTEFVVASHIFLCHQRSKLCHAFQQLFQNLAILFLLQENFHQEPGNKGKAGGGAVISHQPRLAP